MQLMRSTILYLPAQLLGPLAAFLAAVVWTFFLTPSALGVYALVWAIQEVVLLATLTWWSTYTLRYLATQEGPEARRRFDGMEIAVLSLGAVAQTAATLLAIWLVLDVAPATNLAAAILAFSLTRNLNAHYSDRARAAYLTVPYTLFQTVGPVGGLALGVLAALHVAATVEAILWSYALAQGIALLVGIPMLRYARAAPRFDRDLLGAAWAYGAPLMTGSALSWIGVQGIRFIVEHELGAEAVGLLSVGWWLGIRATSFAGMLVAGAAFGVALAKLKEGGREHALPQLATNAALQLSILLPTIGGLLVLNAPLVDAFVAEPFRNATKVVLPIAVLVGALRIFRDHCTDQCFMLFEKPKYDVYISSLDAVATIVCCWIGLKFGGIVGAALGALVATVLSTGVSIFVAVTRFGFYIRASDLARLVGATLAMMLALHLVPFPPTRFGLLLEVAFGAGVFGAMVVACYPGLARKGLARIVR
jgi:O-antigen/teichoic acid export membrane protein